MGQFGVGANTLATGGRSDMDIADQTGLLDPLLAQLQAATNRSAGKWRPYSTGRGSLLYLCICSDVNPARLYSELHREQASSPTP